MKQRLTIALAQINTTVGDFANNRQIILRAVDQACRAGADIVIFPELALCGYPPEDLLLRPSFIQEQMHSLNLLLGELKPFEQLTIILGCLYEERGQLFNSACLIQEGKIQGLYHKHHLPNDSVFDEQRYFKAGQSLLDFDLVGHHFGVAICEDIWNEEVAQQYAQLNVDTLLVLNASPYAHFKPEQRLEICQKHASQHQIQLIYCNAVGGQDELVFDGNSFVLDKQGNCIQSLAHCREMLGLVQIQPQDIEALKVFPLANTPFSTDLPILTPLSQNTCQEALLWQVLALGTRDYLHKTGFKKVVLGLSGGIDSAVVLALAVDVFGSENCMAIMMPSQYTADISTQDAREMAATLGVSYHEVAITPIFTQFTQSLSPLFSGLEADTTEENLQARIRGTLLMAASNKFSSLVLSTGNKSELSTGYCTLYGDMVGAYGVIKDVYKTMVYRLARWRNTFGHVIPERIITRAPSAELRENQTDQDSLPPYEILDAILELMIEHNQSSLEIQSQGFSIEQVNQVARLLRINEYKRHQGALGPRVSQRAFGKDWRYPISHRYSY